MSFDDIALRTRPIDSFYCLLHNYSKRHFELDYLSVVRSLLKVRSSLTRLAVSKGSAFGNRSERNTPAFSPLQGVNFKTVLWTVLKEGDALAESVP